MTARTRIKVCGMTQMAEATGAVLAGVDALGFIFAEKSPRKIEPEKARDIIAMLPPFVDAVGVFVEEEPEVVEEIAHYCGLTVVQLHGVESPEYCGKMSCRVVKAFRVGSGAGPLPDLTPYVDVVSGILLDTYQKGVDGGTGQTFDWNVLESLRTRLPIILAGGLTLDNVGEAVRQVRPFAVDVNSGVEVAPGIKDVEKIRRVVEEVRRTDAGF